LEFEGLLKVFFAEHGTRDDVLATLSSIRVWAQERNAGSLEVAQAEEPRWMTSVEGEPGGSGVARVGHLPGWLA